ncbi:hypothetical protein ACJ73_03400 [Blastomyces percursus]|uniref:Uncharacterized protein n=1 Tax=Blastomyces percursus TaxID=1658174 RepID=A0A1J9RC48_9EURO|nr:hypothetical protein ACJ73_03400 [Blastomyces percursus]
MIRPWVSTLLLVLALISFVSAVDLERGRQARSHVPFAGLFKALQARLWPRDVYLEDYIIAREYELVKRQNRSESSGTSSPATAEPPPADPPTTDPTTPNSTPPQNSARDTSADSATTPQPEPSANPTPQPPSQSPEPEPTPTTQEPPPESTPPTPPPENPTTTSPTPPESSKSSPPPEPPPSRPSRPSRPRPNPSPEPTTKPKPPPSTPTPADTPAPRSSTKLIPTVNADGSPSTITTVVVVQPTRTNSPGENGPKPPGLQTGAAPMVTAGMEKGFMGLLGFSVVIAIALAL